MPFEVPLLLAAMALAELKCKMKISSGGHGLLRCVLVVLSLNVLQVIWCLGAAGI